MVTINGAEQCDTASDRRPVLKQADRHRRRPPLAGKSNVLRELAELTRDSKDLVTFFIEADGDGGARVLQIIANVMADALGWNVTADYTRAWLRSLSRQSGPTLVLAIDGISATRDEVRRDVEELAGNGLVPTSGSF